MRGDTINSIPLCKEFQNGHCARGPQCRYWHINKDEERRKRFHGRHVVGAVSPFGAYTGHAAGALVKMKNKKFLNYLKLYNKVLDLHQ